MPSRSIFLFCVTSVTDKNVAQNHQYLVLGTDSADAAKTPGFTLKDSTTGSILLQNILLDSNAYYGFSTTVTNGFKVLWSGNNYSTFDRMGSRFYTLDSTKFPWFTYTTNTSVPFSNTGNKFPTYVPASPGSSLHFGDYRDVQIRFSKATSFTDLNSNGLLDSGEPYGYDSTNTQRSQRAYFYRRETALPSSWTYTGFKSVPFAVYDIESSNTPRQLDVVVIDHDKNDRWDFEPNVVSATKNNYIYILSTTYNPEGKTYDSTKGGLNLIPNFRYRYNLPTYWVVWISSIGAPFYSALGAEGDINLLSTRPLTSRDAFLFNPTIITGVNGNIAAPTEFSLSQNYPNPFNPTTTIQYSLKQRSKVILSVYNILGQLVKQLIQAEQDAGRYSLQWDGTNNFNQKVSSGMYFYRIEAGDFASVKKMLMLK